MLLSAYFYLNSALYFAFAILMTLRPANTAHAVGYLSLSNGGRSEYLVIYGGLQFGLAAFFLLAARISSLQRGALVFAVCLYAPIALYRVITVARFWPVAGLTVGVATLEGSLLIAALALLIFGDSLFP